MKQNVLITGGTGFIGSHLAEFLCLRGDEVSCLIQKTSNLRWLTTLPLHFHFGEVTDKESLREAVRGKDIIFHLASLTKAIHHEDYYRVNAGGTKNLLEICVEENPGLKRFVLVSSQAAAGPSPFEIPIDETCQPHPITDYGKSKLEAEKIARSFMDKIPITIVRPPAVYGPRDRDIYMQFKMINKGWDFQIGKNDPLVSLVFAPDLSEAMALLADNEKGKGETYFVSNPEPYRSSDLCCEIIKLMGKDRVHRFSVPKPLAGLVAWLSELQASFTKKPALLNRQKILELSQPFWVCSAGKLKEHTGYSCPTPIEKGFAQTIEWYRQNHWLFCRSLSC